MIVIGLGSAGSRHLANLRTLRPDAQVVGADPDAAARELAGIPAYADWRIVLARERPDAAIIASPTEFHLEQLAALVACGIPVYVEKPLVAVEHLGQAADLLKTQDMAYWKQCAVGHQYRFARAFEPPGGWRDSEMLFFMAQDNLSGHYGRRVAEIMTAHPIDTALWQLGPTHEIRLVSDGIRLSGWIEHEQGGVSWYNMDMARGPRRSRICSWQYSADLPAGNEMYLDALQAWLDCLHRPAERDWRLASTRDGLAVVRVIAQIERR